MTVTMYHLGDPWVVVLPPLHPRLPAWAPPRCSACASGWTACRAATTPSWQQGGCGFYDRRHRTRPLLTAGAVKQGLPCHMCCQWMHVAGVWLVAALPHGDRVCQADTAGGAGPSSARGPPANTTGSVFVRCTESARVMDAAGMAKEAPLTHPTMAVYIQGRAARLPGGRNSQDITPSTPVVLLRVDGL